MSRKQINQDIRGLFYGKQSRDRDERNVGRESQPTPGTSSSSGGAIGGGGRSKPQSKKQRLSSEDIEGLMNESQSQETDFLEEPPDEVTLECDELDVVENLEHDFDAGVSREAEEEAEAEGLAGEPEEAGPSTFSQEDAARGLKILDDCLLGVGR